MQHFRVAAQKPQQPHALCLDYVTFLFLPSFTPRASRTQERVHDVNNDGRWVGAAVRGVGASRDTDSVLLGVAGKKKKKRLSVVH